MAKITLRFSNKKVNEPHSFIRRNRLKVTPSQPTVVVFTTTGSMVGIKQHARFLMLVQTLDKWR